ncbi:MAG: hypothetical protein WDO73_31970 [Ignavibacteriota bacterium]
MQKTFGRDLNFEAGYLGSKNTHLGLPESNLNQVPAADLAMGSALTAKVANPYYGQIPTSSSLGQPTIAQQQLLRAFPRFTNVALFRDNVADSEYEAFQMKLEKRFSRGLTFTFAYTFSKLIDDASTYFSQTIFTGPTLTTIGAADAFNRKLERDVSSGDIPSVFSAGWGLPDSALVEDLGLGDRRHRAGSVGRRGAGDPGDEYAVGIRLCRATAQSHRQPERLHDAQRVPVVQ